MDSVVLLNGSPRKGGNTEIVLNECKKVIEAQGLKAEIISIGQKNIQACIACGKCAELKRCVLDDGLNEIIDKIRPAKGFIVGSPVYFGTARGDVMNALQRIGYVSRKTDNFLSFKVGAPIAVGRRGGHSFTFQEMLMFYFINEMIITGSHYWNLVFALKPGEALEDKEGIECVKRFSENVCTIIKKL